MELGNVGDSQNADFEAYASDDQGENRSGWGNAGASLGAEWRTSFEHYSRIAQRHLFSILHLLTCNTMGYFLEHLSPRNVLYLLMSAGIFISAWLSLERNPWAFAVGLLYLQVGLARVIVVEPTSVVVPLLLLQVLFSSLEEDSDAQHVFWYLVCILGVLSEACWWPSAQFLIERSFHAWLVNFSTYYAVTINCWIWPQLVTIDPEKWGVSKALDHASPDVQENAERVGVSLTVLVALPVLACALISMILIWQRNRALCIGIGVVYLSFVVIILLGPQLSVHQAALGGQVPIAVILVMLSREQLVETFGDHLTWKLQAALLFILFVLQCIKVPPPLGAMATGMLVFQLLCKHGMAVQCSVLHQSGGYDTIGGAPNWQQWLRAFLPRRSPLLYGTDQAHNNEVLLRL